MSGLKSGNYWRNIAITFANDIARLLHGDTVGSSELAAATKSLLKRDGIFKVIKTETTRDVLAEALHNLRKAEEHPHGRLVGILYNPDLSGNEKQCLMHLALHGLEAPKNTKERRAVARLLGISVNTVAKCLK